MIKEHAKEAEKDAKYWEAAAKKVFNDINLATDKQFAYKKEI